MLSQPDACTWILTLMYSMWTITNCRIFHVCFSGKVSILEDAAMDSFQSNLSEQSAGDGGNPNMKLTTNDIYKELRLRGYDYGKTFQGILETNNAGNKDVCLNVQTFLNFFCATSVLWNYPNSNVIRSWYITTELLQDFPITSTTCIAFVQFLVFAKCLPSLKYVLPILRRQRKTPVDRKLGYVSGHHAADGCGRDVWS